MKIRTALMTAAVSLALAGLGGCGQEPDTTATSRAPDTTTTTPPADTSTPTTPPAVITPPAADTTATAPSNTTPSMSGSTDTDRTAGQTVDDAAVTAKVKAALLAESNVDGTKINVDTSNGRVTLKGEVPSKTMADRAVQVAKGVEGVKDVDNRLSAGGAG